MTSNFDKFCNLIQEKYKRCSGSTMPELSDNAQYVFSRCAPNPYSAGFKRIYFLRKGEPLSLDSCRNDPRFGTAKYEECRLAKLAYIKRLKRLRKLKKSKNKKD